MSAIRELFATLGLEVDPSGFEKADNYFTELNNKLELLQKGFEFAKKIFESVVVETAKAADDIGELAEAVGVNAQSLQRLAYAGSFAGVGLEDLSRAMGMLARHGVTDLEGEMMKIADQFAKMPDGGEKSKLALEKFGRAGRGLIPVLNKGSAAVRELMGEADDMGVVFDKSAIQEGSDFEDAANRLNYAWKGLIYSIGKELIPVVREAYIKFRGWVTTLRSLIPALGGVKTILQVIGIGIASLVIAWGLMNTVMIAAAYKAAAAWIAALWPLLLLAAGIAAVIVVLLDLWSWFNGGESAFKDLFKVLGDMFPALRDWLLGLGADAFHLWQSFTQGAYDAVSAIIGAFTDLSSSVQATWLELGLWLNIFWNALMAAPQNFANWITNLFTGVVNSLTSFFTGLWDSVTGGIKTTIAKIQEIPGVSLLMKATSAVAGAHVEAAQGAWDMGKNLLGMGAPTPAEQRTVPMEMFGGGASPQASAASSTSVTTNANTATNASQFKSEIVINGTPGMDSKDVANQVTTAQEAWWEAKMRETHAGAE